MFKLYLNKGTRTQIDEAKDKGEIIQTMGSYLKDDPDERFMIVENIHDKGPNVELVNGLLEYALYVEDYNIKLKEESCVELKKFIVERDKVKRLKK